jgi:hypothetical protein
MGKKIRLVIDVEEMGRKGGLATAANRTPSERKAAAVAAIQARWAAYYEAHPEKLKAKLERQAKKRRKRESRGKKGVQTRTDLQL